MKISYFLLIFSFSVSPLWSQSQLESELLKEKQKIEENIKTYREYERRNYDALEEGKKKFEASQKKLQQLQEYEVKFADSRAFAIARLHQKHSDLSVFKKVGAVGKFYKCLKDSLEEKQFLNRDYCESRYRPKLSPQEKEEVLEWDESTGMTLEQAQAQKKTIPEEIKRHQESLSILEKNYKNSQDQIQYLKDNLKINDMKIAESKLIPANQHFLNCDSGTPEINLENDTPYQNAKFKGPFSGVPRDNQDGLGTCYANTAKNLLVGLSGGNDVASFLDLALQYKSSTGGLSNDGLDAGNSCTTLNSAKANGYCPQGFSPLETGERNHVGEGLFKLGPYEYLATNVNLIREFLTGLSEFEKSESPVSQEIMGKASHIISTLKANPDIILPLPIVRNNIPEEWKLKEAHGLKNLESTIPYEKFLEEHREAYKQFYPVYIKAVIEGKNLDQIFELYRTNMSGFIAKYNLANSLDEFKRVFKLRARNDFEDPGLKKKFTASINFLKDIMNKNGVSDENFYEFCSSTGSDSLKFLSSMQPLIEKIRQDKVNEDKLFDKNGKLKSAAELMQMTVAPSCVNKENRKALPPFTCDNGYNTISRIKSSGKQKPDQIKMFRERVVLSLVQGYPLGNSYPTSAGSGHINTIVGLRFNPQSQTCEYLIRESQNGKSEWHREEGIFDKIQGLTEVRRVK